jgi:polysaccharide chain length determinant protein (PEP-CTERM system associated)
MEEPRFDPFDYVSAFNRRKWWFIVPVAASILVGVLLVWLLPRTYQSAATIGVSSPRLQSNLVSGASGDRGERMRAISQQLLSRHVLERAAQLEGQDQSEPIDAAVGRIRSGLQISFGETNIKGNLTPDQRAQLDSYKVTYDAGDPDQAQRILNRVTQVFVEENSKSGAMRAQDTSEFITLQLSASEKRLNELEARLREAKEAYMGRLPEQTNANIQMVGAMQRQLEAATAALRTEQDRLSSIERQIDAMEQGVDIGPFTRNGAAAGNAQALVITLRAELAEKQMDFADRHPEVIRLKQELAAAEEAAAAEKTRPVADRRTVLQTSPEYRQLTKDRETAQLRIAELRRQQNAANANIARYQNRVEAAPRVEQELVSVQREYDLERENYSKLKEKRAGALVNEELMRRQGVEQFAVIVPANFPDSPASPKPLRVMLMAIAAGLVLGAAGVMGREYLDRSVHDARGLRDEFELPVLAEIPRIEPVVS